MTSSYPYNESRNYTFMFDPQDLRGPLTKVLGCHNNILEYLKKNDKNFSGFLHIIKTAMMEDIFAQPQFMRTVFIPSNEYLNIDSIKNIDPGSARSIINFSMLQRSIDKELLTSSPAAYFITEYKPLPQLLVTNISGVTQINSCATIIDFDIKLGNGTIHIIDRPLVPYTII